MDGWTDGCNTVDKLSFLLFPPLLLLLLLLLLFRSLYFPKRGRRERRMCNHPEQSEEIEENPPTGCLNKD